MVAFNISHLIESLLEGFEKSQYIRVSHNKDPLSFACSKFWISPGGTWYIIHGEHPQVFRSMIHDKIVKGSHDDWLRVILDNHELMFDGTPTKYQLKSLKDWSIMNRLKLIDYAGNEEVLI